MGLAIRESRGNVIEDLTLTSGGNTALAVENSEAVTVRRVLIRGGAIGIRLEKVTGGRVENTIVDGSMTGVLLNRIQDAVVVNCTLAGNNSIGLSILDATNSAVFNNIVSKAGTGILVGGARDRLAVDHNLYVALFVGKLLDSPNRVMLGPWRDVSGGLDAHSVQLPVEFANERTGNFRPISRLDWAPDRATVSDWGVSELGGFHAPALDIEGASRSGAVDLGVFEVPLDGWPHDGTFPVADDAGTKSAGLFTQDGRLVRYLFHDLPLKKGSYGYTLPARSQLGRDVLAGDYELRLVESSLRWNYHGITANNGLPGSHLTTDQHHTGRVCFGPDGSLLLGAGWNERGENLRSLDLSTRRPLWSFHGQSDMSGLCVGEDRLIYSLRPDGSKGQYSLLRLNATTGVPIAWPDGNSLVKLTFTNGMLEGLTELGGILYVANATANKIFFTPLAKPSFDSTLEVPAPSSPAADRVHKLIWVVSRHEKLLALDPDGKVRVEFSGVSKPLALAVRGNRLAVASAVTGKVHFFDCSEPANLKPLHTLGRGDGPYGPILPDRFYFQEHPFNSPHHVVLDLDEGGRTIVKDYFSRTVVFDAQGRAIYEIFAQFGNWPNRAWFEGDPASRFFDSPGDLSWFVDAKSGTSRPDAHWGKPPGKRSDGAGFFSDSGRQFGVFHFTDRQDHSGILIVRFENYVGRAVLFFTQEEVTDPADSTKKRRMWVAKRDTNGDSVIDEKDAPGAPVLDTADRPVTWHLPARFLFTLPDGSLASPQGLSNPDALGFVWKRRGLDAEGVPVYQFSPESLISVKERKVPSAYNWAQMEDLGNQSEATFAPNGDYLATFQFGHSTNGMGLSNSGGIDVARVNRQGDLLWLCPLNDFGPIQGIKASEKFLLTSWGHQAEWIGLDPNGLSLGHLGFPAEADWQGYWVDHPNQYCLFKGNDGRLHVLVGDYMQNCQHWFSLENYDTYRSASFPVRINPPKARELAFRPAPALALRPKPEQPRITIRKLGAPLNMDGKLDKWRDAGVTPQILMLPVSGSGVQSARDASAVIRLGYLNQDLYVQILRFDDVVAFHQPSNKSHLHDTLEMALSGFFEGFQFSISRFTDTGPAIIRRRFFFGKLDLQVPADHAPRSVEVLPTAKDVSERRLIEAIYGEDLSNCKVIVTEFKLPIDKVTYQGSEETIFPVRSGTGVWLGFMIDDNDVPGSDIQETIVWPATYGTFNVKEQGAWAVFE